jgi:phosphatidylglycerophosphatase A
VTKKRSYYPSLIEVVGHLLSCTVIIAFTTPIYLQKLKPGPVEKREKGGGAVNMS